MRASTHFFSAYAIDNRPVFWIGFYAYHTDLVHIYISEVYGVNQMSDFTQRCLDRLSSSLDAASWEDLLLLLEYDDIGALGVDDIEGLNLEEVRQLAKRLVVLAKTHPDLDCVRGLAIRRWLYRHTDAVVN